MDVRLCAAAVGAALMLAACSTASDSPDAAEAPTKTPSPAGPPVTVAYFTDSWGAGAHCEGCTAWPALVSAGLEEKYGVKVAVLDFTQADGGNTDELLRDLRSATDYQDALKRADVVVFNQGVNDIDQFYDQVFGPIQLHECGGADNLNCVAKLSDHWQHNLNGFASSVGKARGDKPTAVRFVGVSNEYLTDQGLQMGLGGRAAAERVFSDFNTVSCTVAEDHDAMCLDLRPVLNGPDSDSAANPNSQESMQAVADAIIAQGLPELGITPPS